MATATSQELTPETLLTMMKDRGVERLFFKCLAENDNSKNQIYLGGDLSVINVLPSGQLAESRSSSRKRGASGRQIVKAPLKLYWLDNEGALHEAPNTKLILYPQFPEARMSGFLQRSSINLGSWFNPGKDGRAPGRVLFLGVAADGCIYAYLALPNSTVARHFAALNDLPRFGALSEVPLDCDDGRSALLREIRRIHELGWIRGKRLDRDRNDLPCNSPNCGGYTLEAELGITPNGFAEPDFHGWEVKSFSVKDFGKLKSHVITLMTPEPDGGVYGEEGPEPFMRRFGYEDRKGRTDRINFGGVFRVGVTSPITGLHLVLTDYNSESGKILDMGGGIALCANGECAASWSYLKLMEHWKKKHDRAAYVPNQADAGPPRRYRYSDDLLLGVGTDFIRLLRALSSGTVYYDPGIKMENASSTKRKVKRRSQFRVKTGNLQHLYRSFDAVSV